MAAGGKGRRGKETVKRRGAGRGLGPALLLILLALLAVSIGMRYGGRIGGWLAHSPLGRIGKGEKRQEIVAVQPLHRSAGDATATGVELAEPYQLSLQILNATGQKRLALLTGESLRHWGIDAVDRANAPAWPFPETLLLVRDGRREQIDALAERLGGVPVIVQRREDLMLDGTLILGHDWEKYHWPAP